MVQNFRDTAERRRAEPPTADQVPYCPPHWWIIEEQWQHCRKCGEERPVQQTEAVLEPEVERESEIGNPEDNAYSAE